MGLSKEESLSKYGTEAYTAWDPGAAIEDAKSKGILDVSGNRINTSTNPSTMTTGGELTNYLDSYQNDLYKNLQGQLEDIPSTAEIVASVTPKTPAPTQINRLNILEEQRNKLGVSGLEADLNAIKEEERTIQATLRETTGAEEGKPVALGVMAGRIGEEQRQAQTKLDYLNVRKATTVDQLTTAYNAINTYINYAGLDYNDAVAAYNSEFDQNLKIQNLLSSTRAEKFGVTKDLLDETTKLKQTSIDNARANLTTITNAITSGNVTYDNLSSDEKLQIQKLEVQSGLPVGTVSNMKLSAKDKIMGWSDDKTQAMVLDGNGGFKIISTGFKSSSGTGAASDTKVARANFNTDAGLSSGLNFPDLVEKYASVMSLEEIYKAYLNSEKGKKYGSPQESSNVIALTYKVAKGEMSEDEAREKLGL